MSDRNLLELAAKAAGRSIRWDGDCAVLVDFTPGLDDCSAWHPLTDDGDALRLAVKLGLDVCIDTPQEEEPHTHVIGFVGASADTLDAMEPHGDPYAATRRAIVRTAAAIGKEMP